eukprot:CAMPEP_0114226676 /NCGR_PEP_ID=MMETSP0058-20121206/1364_1 /TAXON_ID=36894 /ORGANISM="Pyramimonas parkeae, CCMP726" /LENGTH=323 /DNA_ID=CAMNT_0001337427 /DNA_START=271 /DNA_END=1242 /DNA_ORIENTATION=-
MRDAICDHLTEERPEHPLVLSLHGPPGVGKSLYHRMLAESLYNLSDSTKACPGPGCPSYYVLFGTDHLATERKQQATLAEAAVVQHLKSYPQSLLVIEEFDKMDCASRNMFKQLLERGPKSGVDFRRSIVILEANVGWLQTHQLLRESGGRARLSMESAHRSLKDEVFKKWMEQGCEDQERVDTIKALSMINMLVPFLPLEQPHVVEVIVDLLQKRAARETAAGNMAKLSWTSDVPTWLAAKAEYDDGKYAIEGAKEAQTIISRHVTRALRLYESSHPNRECKEECAVDGDNAWARHLSLVELQVSPDGSKIDARLVGTVHPS